MARTRATLWSSIWRDEGWTALTERAQRLYLVLLSQPKLSLAGSLDLMPKRWVNLAADTTPDGVDESLAELVEHRFVVVDDDELVIRTFVEHDLAAGSVNKNLVKGMWSAWAAIGSPALRKVVVDAMPDSVWSREGVVRPAEAEELRFEPRLPLPLGNHGSNHGSDGGSNPGSNHLLPPTATATTPACGHGSTPGLPAATRGKQAAIVIARNQIADRVASGAIADPQAVARKRAEEDLWPVLGDRLTAAAEEHPGATAEALAAMVDIDPLAPAGYPTVDQTAQERPRLPEVKPDKTPRPPKAVGLAGCAAARAALRRRSEDVPS